jgi:GT2 family glycosyltransferase
MSDSRVSVVVITRNRGPQLAANLPRLLTLPERPPVIVVDNGSDDDTARIVMDGFPHVVLTRAGRNVGAAGRNIGVALASTPYVAFSDDDSWWTPGALEAAADLLDAHPRLAVVAACVVGHDGREPDPTCDLMAASPLAPAPDLPGPPVLGFIACGAVVRAEPFLAVGGFDELMGVGGEERLLAMDLAMAGWGLCYAHDVVAVHDPSPVRDHIERRRRVIRNDLWHAWLRRRWPAATRQTSRVAAAAIRDHDARCAFFAAVREAPSILRRRRPLPLLLEQQMLALDAASTVSYTSRARGGTLIR